MNIAILIGRAGSKGYPNKISKQLMEWYVNILLLLQQKVNLE